MRYLKLCKMISRSENLKSDIGSNVRQSYLTSTAVLAVIMSQTSNSLLDDLVSSVSVSDLVKKIWLNKQSSQLVIVDGSTINWNAKEDEILSRVQEIANTQEGNGVQFFHNNQIAKISWFVSREEDEYNVIIYGLTKPILELINKVLEVD